MGILLGVLAILGLAGAIYARRRSLIVLEAAALGSVLLAGESGLEFVLGGYQNDSCSFSMTFGFALLLAVYVWMIRRPSLAT